MAARLFVDITPLRRSRDYRRLYFGQAVSSLGSQLTVVAIPYQVYVQTQSSAMVGLVSLVQIGPLLAGSLVGGSVADSIDRRAMMLWSQVVLAATSVALALNAGSARPALWPLFVFSSLAAAGSGFAQPARVASTPAMVGLDLVPAAAALGQILLQVASVVGPAAAGLLLARAGLSAAYWIDAATFAVAFVAILRIGPQRPEGGGTRAGLSSIVEGLRFVRARPVIQGVFVSDLIAMVFGMPRALFPALGTGLYGGDATTVGLLFAAPGAGALGGALMTGWVSRVHRQGLAVLIAIGVWGAGITGFGLTSWLPLGLGLLALAGAADVFSAVFRNTILQRSVPDALRGRLSSVQIAVVTGGPRLGDAEAGAVAAVAGPRFSVVSGGLACIVGVVALALIRPQFRRQSSSGEPSD